MTNQVAKKKNYFEFKIDKPENVDLIYIQTFDIQHIDDDVYCVCFDYSLSSSVYAYTEMMKGMHRLYGVELTLLKMF